MQKIFFALTFILLGNFIMPYAESSCINFSNKSITDDEIAAAIKYPKPASISTVTQWLDTKAPEGKYQEKTIVKLDLSQNNITIKGATQLFKYVSEHLRDLEELDMSINRIRDGRGNEDYEEFEKSLKTLLKMENFRAIYLKVNYLGVDWFKHIKSRFSKELVKKVHW